MTDALPRFTDEFKGVTELANRYASAEDNSVVCLRHLLAAFLTLHLSVWLELLGLESLALPEGMKLGEVVAKHRQTVILSSQVNRILSLHGGRMDEVAHALGGLKRIGITELAAAMIIEPRGPVLNLLQINNIDVNDSKFIETVMDRVRARVETESRQEIEAERGKRLRLLKEIRTDLLARCHGQSKAVETLVAQVAADASLTVSERGFRPVSFAFLGGPGTGKSLLATAFRDIWAQKFGTEKSPVLDMSRFAISNLVADIAGRDTCWKDGGKPGELTRLAEQNPYGVIIIDNLDKAHPGALVPLANMLIDGRLKDEFSGETISFANNIIILITNCGTSYLESGKFARLCERCGGTIPREKMIEGVSAALDDEIPGKAGVISEILAKSGAPILFTHHDVHSLHQIIGDAIDNTIRRLKSTFDAEVKANREALIEFFIETQQKLDSAHGIAQTVNTVLMSRLEEKLLASPDVTTFTTPQLSILLDGLPKIELPRTCANADPLARLEARTRCRIREAKRLDYDLKITITSEGTTLHLTNLRYAILPSIEDAGWFCVTPPDVKPDDLVGLETAWAKARKVLAYLNEMPANTPKPNHILLYGPPGTGKTAFAKSIASTLDRSIICVNGSQFTTSANDTRAVRWLQELFATAERTNSIIFLDECDAIGSRDYALPTQAPVINTLLTLLDGFEENNVMVIGATNRPEMLDPALIRPGRLHTRIKVDVLRKREDRAKLIDIFCRKMKRDLSAELKEFIVQATDSWAPANILNVLRETCDLAGKDKPTRTHFALARNVEFAGDETQRAPLTDDERRLVARHEAGHAFVAAFYRHTFIQVSVNGFGDNLGFLECQRESSIGLTERRLRENIDVALAGNVAERIFGTVSGGSENDFAHATRSARKLLCGGFLGDGDLAVTPGFAEGEQDWLRIRPKVNAILTERMKKTTALLTEHKAELKMIADALMDRKILFADDIAAILHSTHAKIER